MDQALLEACVAVGTTTGTCNRPPQAEWVTDQEDGLGREWMVMWFLTVRQCPRPPGGWTQWVLSPEVRFKINPFTLNNETLLSSNDGNRSKFTAELWHPEQYDVNAFGYPRHTNSNAAQHSCPTKNAHSERRFRLSFGKWQLTCFLPGGRQRLPPTSWLTAEK